MFMFISIQYFTEKLVESYFVTIYNVKNEKNGLFLKFYGFSWILGNLGVACHVRLSAIDFKNHPNAHGTSLAIIIQLYKIWNIPRAEFTSSQIFIFFVFKFV